MKDEFGNELKVGDLVANVESTRNGVMLQVVKILTVNKENLSMRPLIAVYPEEFMFKIGDKNSNIQQLLETLLPDKKGIKMLIDVLTAEDADDGYVKTESKGTDSPGHGSSEIY